MPEPPNSDDRITETCVLLLLDEAGKLRPKAIDALMSKITRKLGQGPSVSIFSLLDVLGESRLSGDQRAAALDLINRVEVDQIQGVDISHMTTIQGICKRNRDRIAAQEADETWARDLVQKVRAGIGQNDEEALKIVADHPALGPLLGTYPATIKIGADGTHPTIDSTHHDPVKTMGKAEPDPSFTGGKHPWTESIDPDGISGSG